MLILKFKLELLTNVHVSKFVLHPKFADQGLVLEMPHFAYLTTATEKFLIDSYSKLIKTSNINCHWYKSAEQVRFQRSDRQRILSRFNLNFIQHWSEAISVYATSRLINVPSLQTMTVTWNLIYESFDMFWIAKTCETNGDNIVHWNLYGPTHPQVGWLKCAYLFCFRPLGHPPLTTLDLQVMVCYLCAVL